MQVRGKLYQVLQNNQLNEVFCHHLPAGFVITVTPDKMAWKSRHFKYRSTKSVKIIEEIPLKKIPAIVPVNLQEQKERFLKHGKTPSFIMKASPDEIEEMTTKSNGQIRFNLLAEAEHILEMVRSQYGEGENFLVEAFGPRIIRSEASKIVKVYLEENCLADALTVIWCNDLPCSARMVWQGPVLRSNRPEARKYSLWLNSSMENPYMRSVGIKCLLNHEIGTHFFRTYNDGLQPWFADRKRFGLRGMNSSDNVCTEEGLAAVNTTLYASVPYLWLNALVYYTACKAAEMTFKQLFDHLGRYVSNREQRWKHVMRVKRGLADPNDLGGYGKDQCYFEGAVQILRNVDNIDFNILMSGKICIDEISRIKRLVRIDCLKIPTFMKNIELYKRSLRQMAVLNGLHIEHPKRNPPAAYLLRLSQRNNRVGIAGSTNRSRRKVRKKYKHRWKSQSVSKKGDLLPETDITLAAETEKNGSETCSDKLIDDNQFVARTTEFLEPPNQSSCNMRISMSISDTPLVQVLAPQLNKLVLPSLTHSGLRGREKITSRSSSSTLSKSRCSSECENQTPDVSYTTFRYSDPLSLSYSSETDANIASLEGDLGQLRLPKPLAEGRKTV